jgi:hypothetical protein
MPGFFPPISLLKISVYRLQPRLFIDSLPYLKKKNKRTIKSYLYVLILPMVFDEFNNW